MLETPRTVCRLELWARLVSGLEMKQKGGPHSMWEAQGEASAPLSTHETPSGGDCQNHILCLLCDLVFTPGDCPHPTLPPPITNGWGPYQRAVLVAMMSIQCNYHQVDGAHLPSVPALHKSAQRRAKPTPPSLYHTSFWDPHPPEANLSWSGLHFRRSCLLTWMKADSWVERQI